jgi:hypothetical protein
MSRGLRLHLLEHLASELAGPCEACFVGLPQGVGPVPSELLEHRVVAFHQELGDLLRQLALAVEDTMQVRA